MAIDWCGIIEWSDDGRLNQPSIITTQPSSQFVGKIPLIKNKRIEKRYTFAKFFRQK